MGSTMTDRARAFLAAWDRAESNRGCYSCAEQHDGRCASQYKTPQPCNCGRVELEHTAEELRAALDNGRG